MCIYNSVTREIHLHKQCTYGERIDRQLLLPDESVVVWIVIEKRELARMSSKRYFLFILYYSTFSENFISISHLRRSQWPRGLKHELSSPAPTLRSWVRIPLEAWMFVCALCAFILCLPRAEAGKYTSTVIPASCKRRQKGNPVV
jgi:hypothetical protein